MFEKDMEILQRHGVRDLDGKKSPAESFHQIGIGIGEFRSCLDWFMLESDFVARNSV